MNNKLVDIGNDLFREIEQLQHINAILRTRTMTV